LFWGFLFILFFFFVLGNIHSKATNFTFTHKLVQWSYLITTIMAKAKKNKVKSMAHVGAGFGSMAAMGPGPRKGIVGSLKQQVKRMFKKRK
jgi:hypothetical protein